MKSTRGLVPKNHASMEVDAVTKEKITFASVLLVTEVKDAKKIFILVRSVILVKMMVIVKDWPM